MTLLKDNNYKDINVALLSLEADIKNKITNFDTSTIDKQLAEINNRIDKINTSGGNNSSDEIDDINSKLNSNSNKIRKLEQNIGDIDTQINGIEQKLSDIFSAENKVTDFNTTTDSGIYYWITDAANRPTDYGVLLVNKYDDGSTSGLWVYQVAYGTDNRIYFRQNINSAGWTDWKAVAYLDDIEKTTTKSVSLSTVTTRTTKYIKLGTFRWYDSFSFRCEITGDCFEDNVNINILGGTSDVSSVCGYYSTNSSLTKSIIVKRGDAWNSDFEIYLKIVQITTADVYVTIDKIVQDRINISESTTAPSGTLEEIVFSNVNGMFTSNIDAKNISGKVSTADTAGNADAIIDYVRGTPIKVRWGGPGIDSAEWYPAFSADGSAIEPINRANIRVGNADTADYAKNMYYHNLDLSELDKTKFYPLFCASYTNFAEVAICSESRMGTMEYNQNRIHFDISTYGWSDTPFTLNIREYTCYDNNEITIGCIGRGLHYGAWAIWIRGGLHYTCFSRDADLSLKTSDYTYVDETYTVGTNYYGGSNSNVGVAFTPQSTITEGAYSSRPITAPRIKADYRMVIPIGAPSYLEDGCIWIER